MTANLRPQKPTWLILLLLITSLLIIGVCYILIDKEDDKPTLQDHNLSQDINKNSIDEPVKTPPDQKEDLSGLINTEQDTENLRTNIDVKGDQSFCLIGRIIMPEGGPMPPDLKVTCIDKKPPISFKTIVDERKGADSRISSYVHSEAQMKRALKYPLVTPESNGNFCINGTGEGYHCIYVIHPYWRVKNNTPVKPILSENANKQNNVNMILLEAGGAIQGKVLGPNNKPVEAALVTIKGELNPFFILSAKRGLYEPYSTHTLKDGSFRFEQVPANERLILSYKKKDEYPKNELPIYVSPFSDMDATLRFNPPCSIRGIVETEAGEPGKNVSVKLFHSELKITDGDLIDLATVQTDENGLFCFSSLKEGSYKVSLYEPGYKRETIKKIKLLPGQDRTNITLILRRGLSISGRLVDEKYKPIPDVKIKAQKSFSLFSIGDSIKEKIYPLKTKSDELGEFVLSGLDKHHYDMNFSADGYSPVLKEKVSAGTENQEIVMNKACVIAGIVISGIKEEVIKEYVISMKKESKGFNMLMDPTGLQNKSLHPIENEKGKFFLNNLAPGEYDLTFIAEGFARKNIDKITLGRGEEARGIVVVLPAEAAIQGVVLDSRTKKPVENVSISLKSGLLGMIESFIDQDVAYSNNNGEFKVSGLSAGAVRLVARHPNYKEYRNDALSINEGETLEGVTIQLSKGAAIMGTVKTSNNTPMAGESIIVANNMATTFKFANTDQDGYYEVTGLPKGAYTVTVMPKSFDFDSDDFVGKLTKNMKSKPISLQKDEVKVCDFIFGETEKGVLVKGRVTENGMPGKHYVLQLYQDLGKDKMGALKSGHTNSQGEYSIKNVKPGAYVMIVTSTSANSVGAYSLNSYKLKVPDRSEYKYDIDIPMSMISGKVIDKHNSTPLPNIRVILLSEDEEYTDLMSQMMKSRVGETYTDINGSFTLKNVKKGEYQIKAGGANMFGNSAGNYATRIIENIKLNEGSVKEHLVIKLEKGGTVEGWIYGRNGVPVADAQVYVKYHNNNNFEIYSECVSDSSGFFRYKCIAPGLCNFLVQHTQYSDTISPKVTVETGKVTGIKINLKY